jgi:hypothetical protein
MDAALSPLPPPPWLAPEKPDRMAGRAQGLFAQGHAWRRPAPSALGEAWGTAPSGLRLPYLRTAGPHLGIDVLAPL